MLEQSEDLQDLKMPSLPRWEEFSIMKSSAITFSDLDQFVVRIGFVASQLSATHVVYRHPADDRAVFLFPPRHPDDLTDPHHVGSVRHLLVQRGLIEEDAFDRWPCSVRFVEPCREPVGAGTTASQ